MDAYLAIGILDGFEPCEDAAQYLAACRYIRDHGPRGVLCGNGTRDAIALADMADERGDEAVIAELEDA